MELKAQEEMLADIQDIMLGKDPAERHKAEVKKQDSAKVQPTPYVRSKADSLLREEGCLFWPSTIFCSIFRYEK